MVVMTMKFNKKSVVIAIILIALLIIGIILLVGAYNKDQISNSPIINVRNENSRVAYLAQYGWEVESPPISVESVLIPRVFSEVFEKYNELQLMQGFDLSEYCGTQVDMYTYKIINEGSTDNVVAILYIYHGSVIGGDVHSTALDGYMTGIKPR